MKKQDTSSKRESLTKTLEISKSILLGVGLICAPMGMIIYDFFRTPEIGRPMIAVSIVAMIICGIIWRIEK